MGPWPFLPSTLTLPEGPAFCYGLNIFLLRSQRIIGPRRCPWRCPGDALGGTRPPPSRPHGLGPRSFRTAPASSGVPWGGPSDGPAGCRRSARSPRQPLPVGTSRRGIGRSMSYAATQRARRAAGKPCSAIRGRAPPPIGGLGAKAKTSRGSVAARAIRKTRRFLGKSTTTPIHRT